MSAQHTFSVCCSASVQDMHDFSQGLDVSVAFVQQGNNLLFLKTAKHKVRQGGAWGLPGGKKEKGESPAQCMQRELQEETGIDFSVQEFDFFGHYYVAIRAAHPINYTLHVFYAAVASEYEPPVVLNPLEHDTYAWQRLDTVHDWDWMPGGKQLIEHFKCKLQEKMFMVVA